MSHDWGTYVSTPQATRMEARRLTRKFGETTAVRELSFAVHAGELFGLVGPDGAGKTTTIRLLVGLLKADQGTSVVLGQSVQTGALQIREAIGYMPQQYSLYGDLSIYENLQFFARLFGISRKEFAERCERLLHITRLAHFVDRRADALSGGMYKKLALACALLHRPQILLLDEPTNGVDPVSRRELWDLLYEFLAEGMAVLVATPYMDEAALCHRVGLINHGTMLAEDTPEQLVKQFPHRVYLISSNQREDLESRLEQYPNALALSPYGASLRVVVRAHAIQDFAQWLKQTELPHEIKEAKPDFEDVFLGRLAESGPSLPTPKERRV